MYKFHLLNRFLLLVIVVLAFFTVVPNFGASASLVKCHTDPIFTLSNGDVVTVTLDIDADASNINTITYKLHVPTKVTAISVVFTPGTVGKKEIYVIVQDSPAGVYTSESTLTMLHGQNNTQVIVYMDVNSMNLFSLAGYDRAKLVVSINTFTNAGTFTLPKPPSKVTK